MSSGDSCDSGDFKLFTMTYNMSGKKPKPEDFSFIKKNYSLYVIGFQEVGPFIPLVCTSYQKSLSESLQAYFGPEYTILCDESLLAVKLFVVAAPEHSSRFALSRALTIATGADGAYGNKGAVACSIIVDETYPMLFITAHFEAHDKNTALRNENFGTIMKTLQNEMKGNPLTIHQSCFFMGDLNYRLEGDYHEIKRLAQAGKYNEMMEYDQLTREKRAMRVFGGFNEEDIYFPPTYKFNKNSMTYDTSKKMRVPSFTDRILFCVRNRKCLESIAYESNMDILVSDHRPVYATFTVKLAEANITGNVVTRAMGGSSVPPKSRVCNVA